MQMLIMVALALLLLAVAVYAHRQIPFYTQGSTNIFVARLVLIAVGGLFGWMGAAGYDDPLAQLARFCIGFGIVHIPAAVILFIKGQRGAGKS